MVLLRFAYEDTLTHVANHYILQKNMEAILELHASALQKQRDELMKRLVANEAQHAVDMPHVKMNLHTFYAQLAQLADVETPDGNCVLWNKDQLMVWLREEFVKGYTNRVVTCYETARVM